MRRKSCFFLLITIIHCNTIFSQAKYLENFKSIQNYEIVSFSSDNEKNDTSKFYITDKGLADTTESAIYGNVVDTYTLEPVKNATVTLTDESRTIRKVCLTDSNGKFQIWTFDFTKNKGILEINQGNYKCIIINLFQFKDFNLIAINFKMKKLLSKN
jgi:hypothetical protein